MHITLKDWVGRMDLEILLQHLGTDSDSTIGERVVEREAEVLCFRPSSYLVSVGLWCV